MATITPVDLDQFFHLAGSVASVCYTQNGDGTYTVIAAPFDLKLENVSQTDFDTLAQTLTLDEVAAIT